MEAKEHKETGASHVTHLRCQDTNPSFSGLHSARDATGAENGSKSTPFRSPIANPILVVEGGQRESPCGCRNCAADLELSSLISLLLFRSLCLLLLPGSHLPRSSSTCARWLNSGQQIRRRASRCSPSRPSITIRCDGASSRCGAVSIPRTKRIHTCEEALVLWRLRAFRK